MQSAAQRASSPCDGVINKSMSPQSRSLHKHQEIDDSSSRFSGGQSRAIHSHCLKGGLKKERKKTGIFPGNSADPLPKTGRGDELGILLSLEMEGGDEKKRWGAVEVQRTALCEAHAGAQYS